MHIWVYSKEAGQKSVNKKDAMRMFETMNWFDNPDCKLNDYQKKFASLVEKQTKARKAKAKKD